MIRKVRPLVGGALVVALFCGAQFVIAQTGQKGSVRQAPAAQLAPINRPVNGRSLQAPQGVVVAPLNEAQCTALGGVVHVNTTAACAATGKACVTADPDGVLHSTCITKD